jgi:hypothetical protein
MTPGWSIEGAVFSNTVAGGGQGAAATRASGAPEG